MLSSPRSPILFMAVFRRSFATYAQPRWSTDGKFFYVGSDGATDLRGKDVRDSCAGWKVVADCPLQESALPMRPLDCQALTIEDGLICQDQTPQPTSSPGQTRSAISFASRCISGRYVCEVLAYHVGNSCYGLSRAATVPLQSLGARPTWMIPTKHVLFGVRPRSWASRQ